MTIERWRHLPIVKAACEFDGTNAAVIIAWAGDRAYLDDMNRLVVRAVQGDLHPQVGDYVVRGIEGEFYPVPRSIFLTSYERVD